MAVLALNNAWGLLSTAMTSQTNTLTLQAGQAARFPVITGADWFYATIFDTGGNIEIVKVTATQGDQFTATRGQDNTTAKNWGASARVQLNITAGLWADFTADVMSQASGARNFTAPFNLSGAPTTGAQATTRKYVTDNALPKTQAIQAPIGFSPVRQATADKTYFGWNGTDCYLQVNSTFLGNVWRDSTYNPATKATSGAQCPWGTGIVEIGSIDFRNDTAATVDAPNPWVMEGYAAQESRSADVSRGGAIISQPLNLRLVWLKNQ